jgi:DNA segregation ATPase FtsK/SpoIIIE-like protein
MANSTNYIIKNGIYYNSKNGNPLNSKEIEKIQAEQKKFSEYRHYKNSQFFVFKIIRFVKNYKNKKNVLLQQQQKEIDRLKLVIASKQKWGSTYKGGVIEWQDSYLKNAGVFNIGMDVKTSKEYIIDFNLNANVLIGGAPGSGKTKLSQMLAYQAIKQGSRVHIGDFKGGTDFLRFSNKCNVITTHEQLIKLLQDFNREHKRRINKFLQVGAENLVDYNKITNENMLREYLIIDELGEAMEIIDIDMADKKKRELEKTIEAYIKSMARLGRCTGMNLIFGTQRPDVGVLQGQTRDQFLKRVCFQAVKNTSNIVLGSPIAEEINEDDKGRCYVSKNINFDEVQVYLFKKDMIKNLESRHQKKHLKLVNESENDKNEFENTFDKNNDYIEEIELDLD